jgi:hypothetical protein
MNPKYYPTSDENPKLYLEQNLLHKYIKYNNGIFEIESIESDEIIGNYCYSNQDNYCILELNKRIQFNDIDLQNIEFTDNGMFVELLVKCELGITRILNRILDLGLTI